MIGKIVTVDRERFPHIEGQNESLVYTLPKDAAEVKLTIVERHGRADSRERSRRARKPASSPSAGTARRATRFQRRPATTCSRSPPRTRKATRSDQRQVQGQSHRRRLRGRGAVLPGRRREEPAESHDEEHHRDRRSSASYRRLRYGIRSRFKPAGRCRAETSDATEAAPSSGEPEFLQLQEGRRLAELSIRTRFRRKLRPRSRAIRPRTPRIRRSTGSTAGAIADQGGPNPAQLQASRARRKRRRTKGFPSGLSDSGNNNYNQRKEVNNR